MLKFDGSINLFQSRNPRLQIDQHLKRDYADSTLFFPKKRLIELTNPYKYGESPQNNVVDSYVTPDIERWHKAVDGIKKPYVGGVEPMGVNLFAGRTK